MKIAGYRIKRSLAALLLLMLCIAPGSAWCDNRATQTVTFTMPAINNITTSGSPGQLEVFTTSNGQGTFEASDSSTTYSFYTNGKSRVITASLDMDTPNHTALQVRFEAPSGANSAGFVTLSTVPQILVSGIGKSREMNIPIIYKLLAEKEAGKVPLTTRRIFYTFRGD